MCGKWMVFRFQWITISFRHIRRNKLNYVCMYYVYSNDQRLRPIRFQLQMPNVKNEPKRLNLLVFPVNDLANQIWWLLKMQLSKIYLLFSACVCVCVCLPLMLKCAHKLNETNLFETKKKTKKRWHATINCKQLSIFNHIPIDRSIILNFCQFWPQCDVRQSIFTQNKLTESMRR